MAGIKLTDLKKHLQALEKAELVEEVMEIAKRFPAVKEYYAFQLKPESRKELLDKYKGKIKNEFYPDRGFGKARISVVNKVIGDFRKLGVPPEDLVELMLFYVDMGVNYTQDFGDMRDKYYHSLSLAYEKALGIISKNGLEVSFREMAHEIMEESSGIGYGFHEDMINLFYEYFLDDEDEL